MKLFWFGDDSKEKPLALLEGKHHDASAFLAKVLAKSFLNQMDWKNWRPDYPNTKVHFRWPKKALGLELAFAGHLKWFVGLNYTKHAGQTNLKS